MAKTAVPGCLRIPASRGVQPGQKAALMRAGKKIFLTYLNAYGTDFSYVVHHPLFAGCSEAELATMYQEHMCCLGAQVRQTGHESRISIIHKICKRDGRYLGDVETETERCMHPLETTDYRLPFLLKDMEYSLRQQLSYVYELYDALESAGTVTEKFQEDPRTQAIANWPRAIEILHRIEARRILLEELREGLPKEEEGLPKEEEGLTKEEEGLTKEKDVLSNEENVLAVEKKQTNALDILSDKTEELSESTKELISLKEILVGSEGTEDCAKAAGRETNALPDPEGKAEACKNDGWPATNKSQTGEEEARKEQVRSTNRNIPKPEALLPTFSVQKKTANPIQSQQCTKLPEIHPLESPAVRNSSVQNSDLQANSASKRPSDETGTTSIAPGKKIKLGSGTGPVAQPVGRSGSPHLQPVVDSSLDLLADMPIPPSVAAKNKPSGKSNLHKSKLNIVAPSTPSTKQKAKTASLNASDPELEELRRLYHGIPSTKHSTKVPTNSNLSDNQNIPIDQNIQSNITDQNISTTESSKIGNEDDKKSVEDDKKSTKGDKKSVENDKKAAEGESLRNSIANYLLFSRFLKK